MHVGLFGGSFNPPHLGHLIVAEWVREQFALDQVWWIPAYVPPHKVDEELAPARDRMEMTRLAVADNPGFRACDIEIRRGGTSYTVHTIRALQDRNPETRFSLILGGDSLRDFGSWYRPEEIVRRVPLLVYRRPGDRVRVEPPFDERVRFADAPLLEISGTDIRARLQRGCSVRYLVPEPVLAYIIEQGLYGS